MDLVLGVYLLISAIRGYIKGFTKAIFSYIRIFLSALMTKFFLDINFIAIKELPLYKKIVYPIVTYLSDIKKPIGDLILNAENIEKMGYIITFIIVFLLVNIIAVIIINLLTGNEYSRRIKQIDKILGLVVSLAFSSILLMLIFYVVDYIPDPLIPFKTKEALSNSVIVKYIYMYNIFFWEASKNL